MNRKLIRPTLEEIKKKQAAHHHHHREPHAAVGSHRGAEPPPRTERPSGPPDQTFEEARYLNELIKGKVPVVVKLRNNEEIRGWIEYTDKNFIRVTRDREPNLFIYKHDIKYLYEEREREKKAHKEAAVDELVGAH